MEEIRVGFKADLRGAGIVEFPFHDLRHCAAIHLGRVGIDIPTAMKIPGHKSERMHRRYNTIINEADLLRAAARINTLISPAVSIATVVNH